MFLLCLYNVCIFLSLNVYYNSPVKLLGLEFPLWESFLICQFQVYNIIFVGRFLKFVFACFKQV